MKKNLLLISFILFSSSLFAQNTVSSEKLIKEKLCLTCHAVDKKLVGPSFKDISNKYNKNTNNINLNINLIENLTNKVLKGTSGNWGAIPMPSNPQLKPEEAEILVKYILNLK